MIYECLPIKNGHSIMSLNYTNIFAYISMHESHGHISMHGSHGHLHFNAWVTWSLTFQCMSHMVTYISMHESHGHLDSNAWVTLPLTFQCMSRVVTYISMHESHGHLHFNAWVTRSLTFQGMSCMVTTIHSNQDFLRFWTHCTQSPSSSCVNTNVSSTILKCDVSYSILKSISKAGFTISLSLTCEGSM